MLSFMEIKKTKQKNTFFKSFKLLDNVAFSRTFDLDASFKDDIHVTLYR